MSRGGRESPFTALVNKASLLAEQVGSGLYEGCTDVELFPSMVETIRLKQSFWTAQLKKYGMPGENLVAPKVRVANKKLREEESRLRKLHSSCYMKCFAASRFMFPKELAASIQSVIDVLENLPLLVKDRIERDRIEKERLEEEIILANLSLDSDGYAKLINEPDDSFLDSYCDQPRSKLYRRFRLPFTADEKYVPVNSCIVEVQQALERANGPHVVVLQGGPGTGKSSLARHVALHYENGGVVSSSSHFGEGVFYLDCSGTVDIKAKQLEFLRILDYPLHHLLTSGELRHLNSTDLHKKLVEHMQEKDSLVVLDNADDCDLLQHLLVPSPRVKYLVTSEVKLLWADTLNIRIPSLQTDDARKIVALHTSPAAASGRSSLLYFQEVVADPIIAATSGNPLALVSLSSAVSDAHKWKEVDAKFRSLVRREDDLGFDLNLTEQYPRYIVASTSLAVDHLPLEAKSVLLAVAAFDDLPIPEVVVRLLVKCTHGSTSSFVRWRDYLSDRGFIQQQRQTVPWSSSQQTTLTIAKTRKNCVKAARQTEIGRMIGTLLGRLQVGNQRADEGLSSDAALMAALFVVYGEGEVVVRAAAKLGVQSDLSHMGSLVVTWLTPLVSLLQVEDEQEGWQQQFHMTHIIARQVILEFICHGNPENGIRGLLALPEAALTVCWALALHTLDKPVLIASQGILKDLLVLLGKKNIDPSTQKSATWALSNFAVSEDSKQYDLVRLPGFVECVVWLLGHAKDEEVQSLAAWTLVLLGEAEERRAELAACPGVLQGLVRGLSRAKATQRNSAWALANITAATDNKAAVASLPGALQGLVRLLAEDVNPCTQGKAAWVLANLAEAEENKLKIALFPGALEGLVKLLKVEEIDHKNMMRGQHSFERLSATSALGNLNAAWALASLSDVKENKISIAKCPGALKGLVRLLNKDVNLQTRCSAAWALVHLAEIADNKGAIIAVPGAMEGLAGLMDVSDSSNSYRDPQQQALWTWRNLSAVWALGSLAEENKAVIATCPGALKGLVGLLGNCKNLNLHIQSRATWALANVAAAEASQETLAAFPGALEALVALMKQEVAPQTQGNAARALAHIVEARKNRIVVAKFPGALEGLVYLLGKEISSYDTQNNAARALATMATAEENQVTIANFPGALEGLVGLLGNLESPATQINAAWALANLGEAFINKEKIASVPGAVEKLLMLLEADGDVNVQGVAARTLTQVMATMSNRLILSSGEAYRSRAMINIEMQNYQQALADLDMSDKLQPQNPHTFSWRRYVRVMSKDYQGALSDANKAIELQPQKSIHWQERGILKRLMGNLQGALTDLNRGLQINPNEYECRKHRAYVKFLMHNHAGACLDAERARAMKPLHLDNPSYGVGFLGSLGVEFLVYKLK